MNGIESEAAAQAGDRVVETATTFNRQLAATTAARDLPFADVYAAAADGFAEDGHHLDSHHLIPGLFIEVISNLDAARSAAA